MTKGGNKVFKCLNQSYKVSTKIKERAQEIATFLRIRKLRDPDFPLECH